MAGKFVLPELGEGVEQGDIVSIPVAAGDIVEPGQTVIELETDKATVEVPFEPGGKITELLVKVGDNVKIGAPLFSYESAEAGGSSKKEMEDKAIVSAQDEAAAGESGEAKEVVEKPVEAAAPEVADVPSASIPAGPAARRLARKRAWTFLKLKGPGPGEGLRLRMLRPIPLRPPRHPSRQAPRL